VDKELKEPTDQDKGLVLLEGAKKYGVAAKFKQPIKFNVEKPIVLQYEVKFTKGITCGGAYLKLLQSSVDVDTFNGQSPYTIMFGPDHCGLTNKVYIYTHTSLEGRKGIVLTHTYTRERESDSNTNTHYPKMTVVCILDLTEAKQQFYFNISED
jgi:hypothetical protein